MELPGPAALDRCAALLVLQERLGAAALVAVGDVDRRELFALDAAGSARSWLRRQVGGDAGQLTLARRLSARTLVWQALATGELSGRGAGQLCAALEQVPVEVAEARLEAVLVHGVADQLRLQLGVGLPAGREPSVDQLALRAELASVVGDALNDTALPPADRLEPVLLLLARETAPGMLQHTLDYLLDALLPDGIDEPDARDFYLDLVPVLEGAWDVRGHLDHQTGTLLEAELARQARARQADDTEIDRRAAEAAGPEAVRAFRADPFDPFDPALPPPAGPYRPLRSKGRLRHDDLTQLLTDAAETGAGTGQPAPVAITIVASLDAVQGRDGALPGQVQTAGRPFTVRPETLQRMGCYSELTAVLLDATGRPIGVSSTRRSADRRERAALAALWGAWCAVQACARTTTVPHHVRPWWLSRETILKDLIPLCAGCHHDVHDGHRTLRLKDGRLIDEHGWA